MTPETDMDGPWALPVTGSPPGMLQDDSAGLSQWLAGKPGAKSLADEAAAGIAAQRSLRSHQMTDRDLIREMADALDMARSRWADLATVIRERGGYSDAGFAAATAKRCEPALTAARERLAREDQPAAVSVQAVERAWLVEWRFNGIQWLYLWPRAPGGFNFTADAAQALRFARREDAEAALQWARDTDARRGAGRATGEMLVTEHEWIAAQPAPEPAEPVAHVSRVHYSLCGHGAFSWKIDKLAGFDSLPDGAPLYAAPPAKPLTEERIVVDGLMMLSNDDAADCAKAFTAGVRFAERAHGIGSDGGTGV